MIGEDAGVNAGCIWLANRMQLCSTDRTIPVAMSLMGNPYSRRNKKPRTPWIPFIPLAPLLRQYRLNPTLLARSILPRRHCRRPAALPLAYVMTAIAETPIPEFAHVGIRKIRIQNYCSRSLLRRNRALHRNLSASRPVRLVVYCPD